MPEIDVMPTVPAGDEVNYFATDQGGRRYMPCPESYRFCPLMDN